MLIITKLGFILMLFVYTSSSDPLPDLPSMRSGMKKMAADALANSDRNLTISLENDTEYGNKQLYGEFINLTQRETVRINFENINPNISFVIVQAHAYDAEATLYKIQLNKTFGLEGYDISIYSDVKNSADTICVTNNHDLELTVYLSVHAFGEDDPVPGGCNMESLTKVAPYMEINITFNYMNVDAPPPSNPLDPECLRPKMFLQPHLTFYVLYDRKFGKEAYFDNIRRMMTLDSIKKNGVIVPKMYWETRRMLSDYRSVAKTFVAVVRSPKGYAVYSPATILRSEEGILCSEKFYVILFVIFLLFLSTGMLICYMGHYWIKAEMLLITLKSVTFLTYGVFFYESSLYLQLMCPFFGILAALLLVHVWSVTDNPVIPLVVPALDAGILTASIVYYATPSYSNILMSNFNFWTIECMIILLTAIILFIVPYYGHMVASSFVGSYIIIIGIDFVKCGSLQYILVNMVRRIHVPNFNKAAIMPPFTELEEDMTAIWVVLAISGLIWQIRLNRDRPDFLRGRYRQYRTVPTNRPNRRGSTRDVRTDENTPLLN